MAVAVDLGWRDELKKYIRSVENLTEAALKRIKQDRIRNNLPFDDAFQKYFLQKTNTRIADVYTDFLVVESLDGGLNLSNQSVNQRNYENGNANILEMPIILEPPNNQNGNLTFVQNDGQMSEQILISIPSNSLPSEVELNRNSEQQSHAQIIQVDEPGMSGVQNRPRVEIASVNVANGRSTNFKSNIHDVELDTVGGGGLGIELTSTRVSSGSNTQNLDTIDLTPDQGDAECVLVGEQNDNAMPNVHVQLQDKFQTKATENVNKKKVFTKNDARTTDQIITQKSQVESLNDIDTNNEQPLANAVKEPEVSQPSMITMPSNANDEVAANDDVIEPTTISDVAAITNDDRQIRPVISSNLNANLRSKRALNGKIAVPGGKGFNQGHAIETVAKDTSNLLNSELINLISDDDDDDDVSQAVDNMSKDVQNVTDQSQPKIQQRNWKNDSPSGSGYLKKKTKFAGAVDMAKRRHECDFCEYSTNLKADLTRHIRTHTNERPYECEVCDKRFSLNHNLNTHMKTHRAMFAFQCSNCRHGFSDKEQCKLHENVCKAKGYECHLCKRVFIRKPHLTDHMRKHNGDKLRCSKCRKHFSFKSNLTTHMKMHGKLFRFQCSICRLGFSYEVPWKLHESRCKAKQYECYLCRKKFYQKCNLIVHMRCIHTGEKPFGCTDCRKQFFTKRDLTRHSKRRH